MPRCSRFSGHSFALRFPLCDVNYGCASCSSSIFITGKLLFVCVFSPGVCLDVAIVKTRASGTEGADARRTLRFSTTLRNCFIERCIRAQTRVSLRLFPIFSLFSGRDYYYSSCTPVPVPLVLQQQTTRARRKIDEIFIICFQIASEGIYESARDPTSPCNNKTEHLFDFAAGECFDFAASARQRRIKNN